MKQYRLPYHGPYHDMRVVLTTDNDVAAALFEDELPFCVRTVIGRLIENAYIGFGICCADCKLNIPVMAIGNVVYVDLDFSFDVRLQAAGTYGPDNDARDISTYKDGTVIVRKYTGPTRWRREYWQSADVQLLSNEDPKHEPGLVTREPKEE